MKKIKIQSKSYIDALKAMISHVRARKIDLSVRHIVIVPDKYTLYVEKKLFEGTYGALDCEVVTLNRLFSKIATCDNYLPKTAGVMLVRKIILENDKQLKCYKKSTNFHGFAESMYDTIVQLKSSAVRPQDLMADASASKLIDIALIYEKYEQALIDQKLADSNTKMDLLRSAIGSSELMKSAHVYAANFDKMTKQVSNIFEQIENQCLSLTESVVTGGALSMSSLAKPQLYEAENSIDEVKALCKFIRSKIIEGFRYADFFVVAPTSYPSEVLDRIMQEWELPHFIESKLQLVDSELCKFLMSVSAVSAKNYSCDEVKNLARNFFAMELDSSAVAVSRSAKEFDSSAVVVSRSAVDKFVNYVDKYAVDFQGFCRPFALGDYATPEIVRQQIVAVVNMWEQNFATVTTGSELKTCVREFLVQCNVADKMLALEQLTSTDCSQILPKITSVLDYFDSFHIGCDREILLEMMMEGFKATTISTLPPSNDCVVVGSAEVFRGLESKFTCIIDFDKFPELTNDTGIISDSDIAVLQEQRVIIEPSVRDINRRTCASFEQLLMNGALYVSFAASATHSPLTKKLIALSPPTSYMSELDSINWAEKGNAGTLQNFCSHRNNLIFEVVKNVQAVRSGENAMRNITEMYHACSNEGIGSPSTAEASSIISGLLDINQYLEPPIAPTTIADGRKHFFGADYTKVSQIESYFACPFKHFVDYCLKIKSHDVGGLKPFEIGTLLHEIIEIFVNRNDYDNIEQDISSICDTVIARGEVYSLEHNKILMQRLKREAVKVARIIAYQLQSSFFEVLGTEMTVGEVGGRMNFPPYTIQLHGGEIKFKGVIDRVDVFGDYARIIDYKTGKSKWSFSDLYYGRKIQLCLYMKVLMDNGYSPSGYFYFPFSSEWGDDDYSHKLIGVYNKDMELVIAMDRNLASGGKSQIINATTVVKQSAELSRPPSTALTTDELAKLCQYAERIATTAIEEIMRGNITPSVHDKECPCDYCDYANICKRNLIDTLYRDKDSIKGEVVLNLMTESADKSEVTND